MKNKVTKESRKDIKDFFKKLSKSKIFQFLINLPFLIRFILSIIFFTYWIIAFILPFLPLWTASIILAILFVYPNIKAIQSKTLYYLNKSWIKRKIIDWYVNYKIKYRKK
jgi:uncharacterized membrane protein